MLTRKLPEGHEQFEITTEVDGEVLVVTVVGDLDVYSAPRLSEVLKENIPSVPRVLLDLSETPFIDSTGLGAIVGGAKQARALGGDVVLRKPQPAARRILSISGLDDLLAVRDD